MIRYSSYEEVNAALIELEELERKATEKAQAHSEKYSDSEKTPRKSSSGTISVNGQSRANGTEENGELHEDDVGETDSDSGSGTTENIDHDDEETDQDEVGESEDEYDGRDPASDEDDAVRVRQKVAEVDPQEMADFDRELRALMQESLDSRKLELRTRPTINMMIPMNLFEGLAKEHHGRGTEGESGDDTADEGSGRSKDVQVRVLVKRGNKQQTKKMFIPRDCSLVQSTKQKEAAELEEKQDIKRLVLEYNDREEEELNAGMQPLNSSHSGGRVTNRGYSWDGQHRSGGPRHRHIHHSGAGMYYGSRRR